MKATQLPALRRGGRGQTTTPRLHRGGHDLTLSRLKGKLLRRHLTETDNPVVHTALKRAAAEAESLAWLTPFPLWSLPALFEEKARNARFYAARQAELRESTRGWVSLAE